MGQHPIKKVKNICISLVDRLYSNGCPVNTQGSFNVDNTKDFAYIVKRSTAFVDKTYFIEMIDCERKMMLTAPRRFGKSINLSMLKYFYEIEVNKETGEPLTKANIHEEAVTDTYNYRLFQNLAVHRLYPELMQSRFGRHPVILLDFSLVKSIKSYENAVNHCVSVVQKAYKQHSYLINSTKLEDYEKSFCNMYCDDVELQKYLKSCPYCHISTHLGNLKGYLGKHFNRKCVVLVDEYDAIFRASLVNIDERAFEECRSLYDGMLEAISLDKGKYYGLGAHVAILSGISRMAMHQTYDLDRLQWYTFLRDSKFHNFHGFSQQEFDILMDTHNIPTDLRQQATKYYNGYCSPDGKQKLYNPYSVSRFLSTKTIQAYWFNSEFFEKHRRMLNYEGVTNFIQPLILGSNIEIRISKRIRFFNNIENLHTSTSWDWNLYEYYCECFYEEGHLQAIEKIEVEDKDWAKTIIYLVKVVNEEVRIMLIEEMKKYYKSSGKFDWESMKTCAEYFNNIYSTSDYVCLSNMCELYSSLEKYCNAFFSTNKKIIKSLFDWADFEKILRSLLYNIAILTKHEITIIDPQEYPSYHRELEEVSMDEITPDIKMSSDHGCVMIQAKYDRTAQDVLNQLIQHSCRNQTTKYVLIGVNLSKQNRLSMAAKIGDTIYSYGTDNC